MNAGHCGPTRPRSDRNQHQFRGFVHVERRHQVGAVHGHGVRTETEQGRDLPVASTERDQPQDLDLTRAQLLEDVTLLRIAVRRRLPRGELLQVWQGRAQEALTAGDGADRANQFGLERVLQDVALDAGVERVAHVLLIGMHAQNQNPLIASSPEDFDRGVETIDLRHVEIENHDIRAAATFRARSRRHHHPPRRRR